MGLDLGQGLGQGMGDGLETSEKKRGRGCPKGGWPNKKKKSKSGDSLKSHIRKFLEMAIATKKEKFICELCHTPFKKIYKLKLHFMKEHSNDIISMSRYKGEMKPKGEDSDREEKPERKSTRFGHSNGEEEAVAELAADDKAAVEAALAPANLIRAEGESWTEGSSYFCMLCSQSFTAFGLYKHHIGFTHSLLIEDYRAKFGRVLNSRKL